MKALNAGAMLLFAAALQLGAQAAAPATKDVQDARAKPGDCGLQYGNDRWLTFCRPDGWILDTEVLKSQGIHAAFYPQGSSWNDAEASGTILYINVFGKTAASTVAQLMASDAAYARRHAPGSVVGPGQPIRIGKLSVPTLRFAPASSGRYETVAYVGEEKALVMFVISSTDAMGSRRDFPAFERLVQSYKSAGSNAAVRNR